MDLTYFNLGPVQENIDWQHEDLLALAGEFPGRIVPFYAVDPRRPDIIKRARQNLVPGKFRGIKIYPNGGFSPADDRLLGVYALCEERGVPVVAHCGPNGVLKYGLTRADRERLSHPRNYEAILTRFPRLRLCLAHFGGAEEWDRQINATGQAGQDGIPDTYFRASHPRELEDALNRVLTAILERTSSGTAAAGTWNTAASETAKYMPRMPCRCCASASLLL